MEETGERQQNAIIPLTNQPSNASIVKSENSSDVELYKGVLSNRFLEAQTLEEQDQVLALRQRVQELEKEDKRLDYAEKLAKIQIQQSNQKSLFKNIHLITAILFSIILGIYYQQTHSTPCLMFLIICVAKSLGYPLGEIGNLFDSLKGLPKDLDKLLPDEDEQINQVTESQDAR